MKHRKFRGQNSPAGKIIDKFGGPYRLHAAMRIVDPENARNVSSIYRWMYSVSAGGTGGKIPTDAIPLIIKAARLEGIFLRPEDFLDHDTIFNLKGAGL